MNSKIKSSICVLIAMAISGCASSQLKQDSVSPEKNIITAEKTVKTLKSTVMATYSGPDNKIKKKSLIAVKAPNMLRYEIKGFFNEPFFMLTINERKVQAYFVQDNVYFEGEAFEADSDLPAAVMLNQGGRLKLKGSSTDIKVSFQKKNDSSGLPASIEFVAGENKLNFSFIDPESGKDLQDTLFVLKAPKTARIITQADFSRYLSSWNSK